MTVEYFLRSSSQKLDISGIATSRLDCLVLLEDVTGKERSWLLAHPEFELSEKQTKKLNGFINRRTNHEPLAYIRNKTEFYGREFYIDHRVLEPRPESETMIELLLGLRAKGEGRSIVDVGTGSGALAVTAKLEMPNSQVLAIDIDEGCLVVARKNAKNLKCDINFLHGDLLEPLLNTKHDITDSILLCNLPYVPDDFQINPAAMNEPRIAIFGGSDGLDLYRKMFEQIRLLSRKPLFVLAESMPPQHEKLAQIAKAAGYKLMKTDDFIQVFEKA